MKLLNDYVSLLQLVLPADGVDILQNFLEMVSLRIEQNVALLDETSPDHARYQR